MADGILLVAHGSRSAAGQTEMAELARRVAARVPERAVEMGYLELSDPPAGQALARIVELGARRIAVVPLMLLAAGHTKSDVPAVVLEGRQAHPGVELRYGRPLGVDQALVTLAARRVANAGGSGMPLVLFARGTSDPDANADACKISRLVAEATGAPLAVTGYSGVTWPTPREALDQVAALGAATAVTFSWFLATGVLVDRLREASEAFARESGVRVVDAGYFGPSSALVDLVVARAEEAFGGDIRMNCDTCAYRAPFPGLEDRAGQALGHGHSHLAAEHRAHHRDALPTS